MGSTIHLLVAYEFHLACATLCALSVGRPSKTAKTQELGKPHLKQVELGFALTKGASGESSPQGPRASSRPTLTSCGAALLDVERARERNFGGPGAPLSQS